jgi:integrase/recombinase XerD
MTKYSTGLHLEKRQATKKRKNDQILYPVKLRVTIGTDSRYYGVNCYLTKDDFDLIQKGTGLKTLKPIFNDLNKEIIKADEILNALKTPNFADFKKFYKGMDNPGHQGEAKQQGNVLRYYNDYIQECKEAGRLGTASSYECSMNSLNSVMGLDKVNFKDITKKWLETYELKMIKLGKTYSTVGIYLRPLRYLYGKAIHENIATREYYPFKQKGESDKVKYVIPSSEGNKRPLMKDEVDLLKTYEGHLEKYRDFFILSLYFSGLNFADLLTLHWKNIDGNVLSIVRQKTKNTTKSNQKKITMNVGAKAMELIKKYSTPGSYIFDIVNDKDSPEEKRRKVMNFNRNTNQALKSIAKQINTEHGSIVVSPGISTVYARHTAASKLANENHSIYEISELLGHNDVKTTMNYLSSLGTEGKQKASDILES